MKGRILVILQFLLITILMIRLEFQPHLVTFLLFKILALTLALVAFFHLKKSKFSIYPEPNPQSSLIRSGPYRYIRHPMYTSIMVFFFPSEWPSDIYSPLLYLLLTIVLIVKMNYEESLLKKSMPLYQEYCLTTCRLIPFLY